MLFVAMEKKGVYLLFLLAPVILPDKIGRGERF